MSRNSEPGGIDRRALRTRQLLSQALRDLGAEQKLDAIEVGDLAETAGVARSTFYAHYSSKEDFFSQAFVNMIAAAERTAAANDPARKDLMPSRQLLEHFAESRAFVANFAKSDEMPRMIAAGEATLRAIVETNLERRMPDWTRERRRETAVYIAAGFMGLTRWWMETGMKRSAAELQEAFERLSQSALAQT
jgi:AcrR family transcriptional regulator